MNKLSSEVQEKIFTHLSISDYTRCVSVCRYWNSIFLPQVYRNIQIRPFDFFRFYILAQNSPTRDYIRSIDLSSLNGEDFNPLFDKIIASLPHLERIVFPIDSHWLDSLLSLPILNSLVKIDFAHPSYAQSDSLISIYTKYQSHLTHLSFNISYFHDNFPAVPTEEGYIPLIEYLPLFPKLEDLTLYMTPETGDTKGLLDQIFAACPGLVSLYYHGKTISDFSKYPEQHTRLTRLELSVDDIGVKELQYIQSKCPKLRVLKLHLNGDMKEPHAFFQALMSLSLDEVEIKMDADLPTTYSSVFACWYQSISVPAQYAYEGVIYVGRHIFGKPLQLSFTTTLSGTKKVFCKTAPDIYRRQIRYEYMKEYQHLLTELVHCNHMKFRRMPLKYWKCPRLTTLTITYTELTGDECNPFLHVRKLTMKRCPVNDVVLDVIEHAFPNLKELVLHNCDVKYTDIGNNVDFIQIPRSVEVLHIKLNEDLTKHTTVENAGSFKWGVAAYTGDVIVVNKPFEGKRRQNLVRADGLKYFIMERLARSGNYVEADDY
ncbi:hypothetical protein BDB01DRAFT_811265 [Pilobolus umbonatus]|nr:hypothetical protein BDB01DRAFT_811265 [Pilobolus umbonatus]